MKILILLLAMNSSLYIKHSDNFVIQPVNGYVSWNPNEDSKQFIDHFYDCDNSQYCHIKPIYADYHAAVDRFMVMGSKDIKEKLYDFDEQLTVEFLRKLQKKMQNMPY